MSAVWVAVVVVAVALVVSAPYWLPGFVVGLRVRIFARINGDEGVPVPGRQVGVPDFRRVYAHPAANGRSRGAALSDLFWYWLAPGPQVHQEHLEPGPRYDEAARATRQILAGLRKDEWANLVARCASRILDGRILDGSVPSPTGSRRWRAVRLRDLMMPIWAEVYYEAVFGQQCPAPVRDLIVANADDVVGALKCTRLRHMARRDRLTRYLRGRVDAGTVPVPLPSLFTAQEQAWYLQGTFFNTAVVQMSEAMAHLLMVVAERPDIQDRLRTGDDRYLDRVIDETMRVYPLFGVAHRITSADITLDGLAAIPAGSVLLFNYAEYQHAGYHRAGLPDGDRLDPDRWEDLAPGEANFIPFGISANRPCPARGIAPLSMRVAAREVLARFALATSAAHTRSLPNRGPCLLSPLSPSSPSSPSSLSSRSSRPRGRLALMRARDRWEDVSRSLTQLALGTYMVLDARRKRLCHNYFATLGEG